MMKRLTSILVFVPAVASAQVTGANPIASGLDKAVPYVVAIGGGLSVIGLVFAGYKFTSGDPTAKDTAKSVLVGAVLIMTASAAVGLIKSWFGAGY